ncbi:MAG: endonuclease/exonuclease/phosphatase (EEP) superfamily protein YafD [Roseivirga sp.]|jgi:endonuclease/exonuclease/phosphatase (EEP) superfamily protein YafD
MKVISKISIGIWCLITLLVYCSVWVSPAFFKYAGFVSLIIPFFILANAFWLVLLLFNRKIKLLVPLALLIIAIPFIRATIAFHPTKIAENSFNVMSYNMMRMNKMGNKSSANSMKSWLQSEDSDIKCFQEFVGTKEIISTISNKGKYHSFVGGYGNSYAIFSKFKIINSGVFYKDKTSNNILFADLKVNNDTIRVYNVHLQSMSINPDKELNQEGFEQNYESVRRKFEIGSVRRASQLEDLLKHIENCKYPILITGDFNDIPFSYNYFRLSRSFKNAFENAGNGLGFTYNGKIPFLRIDNQFYNDQIEVFGFRTLSEVDYSDHFPVIGIYSITN